MKEGYNILIISHENSQGLRVPPNTSLAQRCCHAVLIKIAVFKPHSVACSRNCWQ